MGWHIHRRLERLEERVGPSENPDAPSAGEFARKALDTAARLIHIHGDEIAADYRERLELGEGPDTALVAAKRAILETTEEGREALVVMDALRQQEQS